MSTQLTNILKHLMPGRAVAFCLTFVFFVFVYNWEAAYVYFADEESLQFKKLTFLQMYYENPLQTYLHLALFPLISAIFSRLVYVLFVLPYIITPLALRLDFQKAYYDNQKNKIKAMYGQPVADSTVANPTTRANKKNKGTKGKKNKDINKLTEHVSKLEAELESLRIRSSVQDIKGANAYYDKPIDNNIHANLQPKPPIRSSTGNQYMKSLLDDVNFEWIKKPDAEKLIAVLLNFHPGKIDEVLIDINCRHYTKKDNRLIQRMLELGFIKEGVSSDNGLAAKYLLTEKGSYLNHVFYKHVYPKYFLS